MAKYKCQMCGYIYDEEKEGVPFDALPEDWACPLCHAPKGLYERMEDEAPKAAPAAKSGNPLAWPEELVRHDGGVIDEIHALAETGRSVTEPMETLMRVPGFDDILILGAQLATQPLDDGAAVSTRTVIGKHAKKPMVLDMPIYVSHMSFGALSKETKIALSRGAALAGTAMCSGEGGILPEERDQAYRYIFEYVPNLYSVTDENLQSADAIEIKIGQGTKPGMGGHLPGGKVTAEIAAIRGKPQGQDVISPSHFARIKTPADLKELVDELRARSGGRPIGVKLAAGHIERDLEFLMSAAPDFVTFDGRGGATGSSPKFLKDASSVPTVYALARARKFLDEHHMDCDLVITGGLRTSRDFVKALAMGADAVAVASGALIALACQRYRVCHNDRCPMGVATQDPELRGRLIVDVGAKRVANYLNASTEELRAFARCTGHGDIHDLTVDDLCTVSEEIAKYTGIAHA